MKTFDFDQNATTKPAPEVVEAMRDALERAWHNPSSVHRGGQEARRVVELARAEVAALIGARAKEVTFTSGGTEAIDLAVRGLLRAAGPARRVLVTSRVEHAAVRGLAEHLARSGLGGTGTDPVDVRWAPVDEAGIVRLDELEDLIDERAGVVCLQWANNETGGVQPVGAIAALCRSRGVRFVCDGTQWVGKMPARVSASQESGSADAMDAASEFNGDVLIFSPHKFHGPKGVGVVYARAGTPVPAALHGTQEQGRRGGTENVPGIAGAGAAAALARAWLEQPGVIQDGAAVRDHFESAVLGGVAGVVKGAAVNGPASGDPLVRLWNATNIGFPRLEAEALLLALSERGVYASAGAACSSGALDPSPVLLAMGVPEARAHGSLRFSIGRATTLDEVEEAARIVVECVRRLAATLPG